MGTDKTGVDKVVLAYSGGLDTSIILRWLEEEYGCEVVTFTADLGQGEELESARTKAEAMGVTEIYIHPAVDTAEVRAIADDWAARVDDHDLVTNDSGLRTLIERSGAELIGFRELRDLQRSA